MSYEIAEIFASIQGEGVLTGTPMVFVRFQGCSVGCPWCDTKYSWPAKTKKSLTMGSREIEGEVRRLAGDTIRWVLLTGGEPCEQPLAELTAKLEEDFSLALETSGTSPLDEVATFRHICISPKEDMPGGRKILPSVVGRGDEFKFVVSDGEDVARIVRFLARFSRIMPQQCCVQPRSLDPKATQYCAEVARQRGWRLSLQTHRLVGIR